MGNALNLNPDFSAIRHKHALIALSGGADSVALAALLASKREEYGLQLSAAHMDHAIRPESAEDAEFCRTLCERLSIPFYTVRADIPAEAARLGVGLETAARQLRHAWLNRLRSEINADCVALAHHMDDQAETVLMHLARGAGPGGAGGMRALNGWLYRPLLGFRKAELTAYLVKNGFTWREDITNAVDDNPRNAIRLHVIPELEKSYPQFVRAAARYAQSAQIESDYVSGAAMNFLGTNHFTASFGCWIDLSDPPPRAVLRRAIIKTCPAALDWEQLNAVEALCGRERGKFDLGTHWLAERAGNRIYFVQKHRAPVKPAALSLNGRTCLPGLCAVTASACAPVPIRDDPTRQVLSRAALEGAVLRTRRPGDRIRPLGCGDRLLSDYLIDKKADRPLRDHIALVAKGNRVLWVCGFGIAEDAKLTGDSAGAVLLECGYDYKLNTNQG